jgi:hypothetical protein
MTRTIVDIAKRILIVAVVIVVLPVFGAVVYVLLSDSSLVKAVVESMATDFAGAQVHIGRLGASLGDKTVTLTDVVIFNPPGFKGDSAIRLGQARVAIEPTSLFKDSLVVREIAVDRPEVSYEVAADGKSNVEVLGVHALGEIRGHEPGPQRRVVIERLDVTGGAIGSRRLADVHLTGLGSEPGGAAASEVAEAVLAALARAASGVLPAAEPAIGPDRVSDTPKGSPGGGRQD